VLRAGRARQPGRPITCFRCFEVGAGAVRAKDWSATSLGPSETWPESSKTAVSICLNSRFPICLWLGPELRKLCACKPHVLTFVSLRRGCSALVGKYAQHQCCGAQAWQHRSKDGRTVSPLGNPDSAAGNSPPSAAHIERRATCASAAGETLPVGKRYIAASGRLRGWVTMRACCRLMISSSP